MKFGEFTKFHRKSGGMGHPEICGRDRKEFVGELPNPSHLFCSLGAERSEAEGSAVRLYIQTTAIRVSSRILPIQ
jgi:hypothetical protein